MKDQRRFPELNNSLEVSIHEVEVGKTPFDFNFFAFDPQTGAGVYQVYFGACPLLRFGGILQQRYDDLVKNDFKADKSLLAKRGSNRRSRTDKLDFSVVFRRPEFESAVKDLRQAKSFEYDIVTAADMSDSLKPLSRHAKLERRTVRLKPNVSGNTVWRAIKAIIPDRAANAMFRVSGKDSDGVEQSYDYGGATADEFHRQSVEEMALPKVLCLKNIKDSPYVATMLTVMKDQPLLLGEAN